MNRKIRVAAAQMEIICNDYEGNLKRCEEMVAKASEQGAEIVCFPEYFSTGIPAKPEPIPGPTINFLLRQAKEQGIDIIAGTIVEEKEKKIFNTCCYISKDGEILAKYSKIHLWVQETRKTPGDRWVVVKTPKASIGLIVCWDAWFPESCRILALRGAEIIFCPTWVEAWGGKRGVPAERKALSIVRAAENQLFFVDVVACGYVEAMPGRKMRLAGHSRIVSPGMGGRILAEGGYKPALLIADLELKEIQEKRAQFRIFETRKPKTYGDIVNASTLG